MASITFKHIEKTYPGKIQAVRDFNFKIEDEEFVVLVGPSGCGKTTTLRMVAGLEEVSGGELLIGETMVNHVPAKKRDIAMVFQNYALYPHMTVYDNMAFALKLRKIPRGQIKQRVQETARVLDIEHLLQRRPKALSGGQRQRVALGRAMVREPSVFLLDEPLSNLDAKLRASMRVELIKLHKRLGTTFLYVTHDQTEAMTMGDRLVVMKDGVMQQADTPQNLYNRPCNRFVAEFIGTPQMNFVQGKLVEGDFGYRFESACGTFGVPAKAVPGGAPAGPLHMGVRPENIACGPQNGGPGQPAEAVVEVCEQMGNEGYLHLRLGENRLVARVPAGRSYAPGEVVKLWLDMEKAHFFDAETGARQ